MKLTKEEIKEGIYGRAISDLKFEFVGNGTVYLSGEFCGTRITGSKSWGLIQTKAESKKLTLADIELLIEDLKKERKRLKNRIRYIQKNYGSEKK